MPRRLLSPEWRESAIHRMSIWIVFAAVVIGIIGVAWGIANAHSTKLLAQENLISQTNHHAASVRQQATIIAQNKEIIGLTQEIHDTQVTSKGTLTAIANLESEVANVIEGLPAADKILNAEAMGLDQDIKALCVATGAPCQGLSP